MTLKSLDPGNFAGFEGIAGLKCYPPPLVTTPPEKRFFQWPICFSLTADSIFFS